MKGCIKKKDVLSFVAAYQMTEDPDSIESFLCSQCYETIDNRGEKEPPYVYIIRTYYGGSIIDMPICKDCAIKLKLVHEDEELWECDSCSNMIRFDDGGTSCKIKNSGFGIYEGTCKHFKPRQSIYE